MARKNVQAKPKAKDRLSEIIDSQQPKKDEPKGTIVFFHPDLGIGGAERLVVDAAVGLQERGHRVVIFTNHCDPSHCFDECSDGTLDVRVRATTPIPMSFLNRLTILCAILRHLQLLLQIALTGELAALRPRAVIADQLSAGLPFISYLCPNAPILFYCHFPDLLLAQGRETSLLKRMYRVPFDALEEWSMSFAHSIAVNSNFTRGVVGDTWPSLRQRNAMRVVYPCVDTSVKDKEMRKSVEKVLEGEKIILSINRFERKKDIALAIKAFALIPEDQRKDVRLVIAGGYDPRIDENVTHLTELQALATSLSLGHTTIPSTSSITTAPPASTTPILFLPSVPTPTKTALLRSSRLLVYTPSAEHFGIVPLEAMLARVPVLAATTGGPIESVRDGVTGWLRPTSDTQSWADVMATALGLSEEQVRVMGEAGQLRVREVFGRDKMAERFDDILVEMSRSKPSSSIVVNTIISGVIIALAFGVGLLCAKGYWDTKEAIERIWSNMTGQ